MKVLESLEHGDIVKDIPPWEESVNQDLRKKPWSISLTPSVYANKKDYLTKKGLDYNLKRETHIVDVSTIKIYGGTYIVECGFPKVRSYETGSLNNVESRFSSRGLHIL